MCILSFGNNCEVVKKNGNKGHSFPASTTVVGFKALQVKFHMRRCQIEVQVESGRRPKSKEIF